MLWSKKQTRKKDSLGKRIATAFRTYVRPVKDLAHDLAHEICSSIDFFTLVAEKVLKLASDIFQKMDPRDKEYDVDSRRLRALTNLGIKVEESARQSEGLGRKLKKLLEKEQTDSLVRDGLGQIGSGLEIHRNGIMQNDDLILVPVGNEQPNETREFTRMAMGISKVDLEYQAQKPIGPRKFREGVTRFAQAGALLTSLVLPPLSAKVDFWTGSSHSTISLPATDSNRAKTTALQRELKELDQLMGKFRKGLSDSGTNPRIVLVPMERTEEGTEIRKDLEIERESCVLTLGRTVYITYA